MTAWIKKLIAAHRDAKELDRLRAAVEERDRKIMLLQLLLHKVRDSNADLDRRIVEWSR